MPADQNAGTRRNVDSVKVVSGLFSIAVSSEYKDIVVADHILL